VTMQVIGCCGLHIPVSAGSGDGGDGGGEILGFMLDGTGDSGLDESAICAMRGTGISVQGTLDSAAVARLKPICRPIRAFVLSHLYSQQ